MSMTPSQARVVDPILSTHVRGYKQPGMIGNFLFPRAPVAMYGGKILTFGKEAFRLYNTRRAPGGATKRIDFGYEGDPFAIVPSGLEAKVPRELMRDATQVPGIDLGSRAVNTVMRVMTLSHEYECARILRGEANYDNDHKITLAAGDRWTSPDSDPNADVELAKASVAASIGIEPNTAMLSAAAFAALKYHPKLLEHFKFTKGGHITLDMLKDLWDIEHIHVGKAKVAAGDDDKFGDVWGRDAWFGYVTENLSPNVEEPSFGYTYFIEDHPIVEVPYWDNNAKSWIYGVSDDNSPVLSGMGAGYLIVGAGAPAA